ncbi:hypothetical protein KKH03_01090 [Patescibacteria group bacterium]|nr:hypothetical protein [Patescibacteria group bacterium]
MIKPLNNIHLKLLALLAAIFLWFIVITVENTVYLFPDEITVEVTNLGKNLSLADEIPKVKLYLRIDKEDMKTLTKNDFRVFIDLKDVGAGPHLVDTEATSASTTAKILKVEPARIALTLAPTTEKEVDVKVNVVGSPMKGYKIGSLVAQSDKVKISGAQKIIDSIDHVQAQLLLTGTEENDLNQSVALTLDLAGGIPLDLVSIVPDQLVVSAEIVSQLQQKEVDLIPGFKNDADREDWANRIKITPGKITIEGETDVLDKIDSITTKPFETSILESSGSLQVRPDLPKDVSLVNKDEIFTVTLANEPTI